MEPTPRIPPTYAGEARTHCYACGAPIQRDAHVDNRVLDLRSKLYAFVRVAEVMQLSPPWVTRLWWRAAIQKYGYAKAVSLDVDLSVLTYKHRRRARR